MEWLADVPEHWEISLLGRSLERIEQGWSPVAAEGALKQDQWAVLTLSSVKRGCFITTALKPTPDSADIPDGIAIADGDLLLTRSNTRELVGDVCVVQRARPKTVMSDLIYRLDVKRSVLDPRFLMYQLLGPLGRRHIERDARGSSGTMPKIGQRHIRAWRIIVPLPGEQRRIVDGIDAAVSDNTEAKDVARREISLLREYRTRLITDVVTGKLDVREAVARLPDDVDKLESLDKIETLSKVDGEILSEVEIPEATESRV